MESYNVPRHYERSFPDRESVGEREWCRKMRTEGGKETNGKWEKENERDWVAEGYTEMWRVILIEGKRRLEGNFYQTHGDFFRGFSF